MHRSGRRNAARTDTSHIIFCRQEMSFDALECCSATYIKLVAVAIILIGAFYWPIRTLIAGATHSDLEPASIILSSSLFNPASSVRPTKRLGAEASTL